MGRVRELSESRWSLAGGVLVIAICFLFLLAYFGGGGSDDEVRFDPQITARQLSELRVGSPRDRVEAALGTGQDALEYGQTGPAVEPRDAECTYYTPGSGFLTAVVQLCYRDDRLVSKRRYELPFAQDLSSG